MLNVLIPGFFLLAMISLSLLPIIKKELDHLPTVQEKVLKGLLLPLAIADVGTLQYYTGSHFAHHLWTYRLHSKSS